MPASTRRRICFVTGTRAEFGLMRRVLAEIKRSKRLTPQIVVTGMHLDPSRGKTITQIGQGWRIDAVVPWRGKTLAASTGSAIAGLADAFGRLKPDIVMVVGDRVEGFAAATAAHLGGIAVAHVHGGDRALGQVDDSLRHAITKLAHIHFPATADSALRIARLGESKKHIHPVGSPGVEDIRREACSTRQLKDEFPALRPRRYALLVMHPVDDDEAIEFSRADLAVSGIFAAGIGQIVIIYPNNDPGAEGITRRWRQLKSDPRAIVRPDVPRPVFLGLLREAAVLVGNSSSGIIEAASFGTPVVDVGPRQAGRLRCKDVRNVPYRQSDLGAAVARVWNDGHPIRGRWPNPYEGHGTARKIVDILVKTAIDARVLRKLIAY